MKAEQPAAGYVEAANEFNSRTGRSDGANVAAALNVGLALLQDLLYCRLHGDVQRLVGKDSMLMPVSELKTQWLAKTEMALYQAVESSAAAVALGAVGADADWYLRWLVRLLLGESLVDAAALARLAEYGPKPSRERLLAFTDVLAKVLPESRQAPLMLFNLFPLSVQIATAVAFGDPARAADMRKEQLIKQPAFVDCGVCKGRLLKTGKQCPKCGNPLWKHEWLVAD
jgi:hypothetical protein